MKTLLLILISLSAYCQKTTAVSIHRVKNINVVPAFKYQPNNETTVGINYCMTFSLTWTDSTKTFQQVFKEVYPNVTEQDYDILIVPAKFVYHAKGFKYVEIAYRDYNGVTQECTFQEFKEMIWPIEKVEQSPPQVPGR